MECRSGTCVVTDVAKLVNGSCKRIDDDTLQCCTEISKEQSPDGFTTVNLCKNYAYKRTDSGRHTRMHTHTHKRTALVSDDTRQYCTEIPKEQSPDEFITVNLSKDYAYKRTDAGRNKQHAHTHTLAQYCRIYAETILLNANDKRTRVNVCSFIHQCRRWWWKRLCVGPRGRGRTRTHTYTSTQKPTQTHAPEWVNMGLFIHILIHITQKMMMETTVRGIPAAERTTPRRRARPAREACARRKSTGTTTIWTSTTTTTARSISTWKIEKTPFFGGVFLFLEESLSNLGRNFL